MRKLKIFFCSVFILFQFISLSLFAQTRQTSQQDTSKVSTKNKSRIELPDVLIYGEDRSKRQSGTKISPLESESKIVAPPSDYQPSFQLGDNQKHSFLSESSKLTSRKMVQLNYGKFQQLETKAGWWQETDKINFGLHGGYSRSDGQFENSHFDLGQINGQIAGYLTEDLSLKSKGGYQYFDYGLYGAEKNNLKRKNTGSDFTISGTWTQLNKFSTEFGLNIQNNNFEDRDSTNKSLDFSDSEFSLTAKFNTKYRAAHFAFKALYCYNGFENNEHETTKTQKLLKINPEITFSWRQLLIFRTGLIVQNIKIADFASETFFSPDVKIIFTPTQNLGFELKVNSGYEIISYLNSWKNNPFISSEFEILPFKKRLQLQFGAEYQLASNVNFKSDLTRTDWKNYAYWSQDKQTGLFHLKQLNNVVLFSWSLMSEIELSNVLKFKTGFRLTVDSIDKNSLSKNKTNLPYLESVSVPISFNYKVTKTADVAINFDWIGPRKTSLTNNYELPGYGLLSVRLQKQLIKNYSVFISGQNLLNQKYEQWENYPGRGIYFETGLRGNW
jgi:outer membrane receptor protein involved in Fe transport